MVFILELDPGDCVEVTVGIFWCDDKHGFAWSKQVSAMAADDLVTQATKAFIVSYLYNRNTDNW